MLLAAVRAGTVFLETVLLAVPALFVAAAGFAVLAGFAVVPGFAVPAPFGPLACCTVRVAELGRTEPTIRTGADFVSAVLFVAATDFPPIWTR